MGFWLWSKEPALERTGLSVAPLKKRTRFETVPEKTLVQDMHLTIGPSYCLDWNSCPGLPHHRRLPDSLFSLRWRMRFRTGPLA